MNHEDNFQFLPVFVYTRPHIDSYDDQWGFILLYRWNNPVYSFFNLIFGRTVWSLFSITAEWPNTMTFDVLSFGAVNVFSIGRHEGSFFLSFFDYYYHEGSWHTEED